jgi:mono/diheme cytochrome c family protein
MRAVLGWVALALALTAGPVAAGSNPMAQGKRLVTHVCGRCHGVAANDRSKHPQAPPFREVMKRYPADSLAEALAEGIVSGHPDMPVFVFKSAEIDAIVTYLGSLQPH